MAFHQPTRQAPRRALPLADERETHQPSAASLQPQASDELQTWVLFSPAADACTTASYLSSVADPRPTPGRSQLSGLDSLNTLARSDVDRHPASSALSTDAVSEDGREEDAELDSLDSHLPEFRSQPGAYGHSSPQHISHAAPVPPAHDGFGSFRLDSRTIGEQVQDHIYAFERFNPRRLKRQRESLDLSPLDLDNEHAQELDRMRRIEAWRLEQSKILLDEVQKETRRRRQSIGGAVPRATSDVAMEENAVTMSTVGDGGSGVASTEGGGHEQLGAENNKAREGIWSRFTRTLIRDLMGINDRMLSILLGEGLPDDEDYSFSTPKESTTSVHGKALVPQQIGPQQDSSRQLRILNRIARELGLLVHQLSSHPGAFSTYVRMQQMPMPYAGLPVIPEAAGEGTKSSERESGVSNPSTPVFQPTMRPRNALTDVHSREPQFGPDNIRLKFGEATAEASTLSFTQKEWEQDLDIKLVFKYLRSRFTSRASSSGHFHSTSHLAMSSTQDAAAKVARVRQHHPLVSRSRPAERRVLRLSTPSSPVGIRHAASCASQSAKWSARRSSVSSRHSSRHYWDIGDSVGTGSLITSTGPMGSWGEV